LGDSSTDVVICGAGIAGVSAAYSLAIRQGVRRVVLVDERPPLSLTSDKSTEAYRNWWPGPDDAMIRLMNRSIDLLEELARSSGNQFLMNRRGYLFATANPERADSLLEEAREAEAMGAGTLRVHDAVNGSSRFCAPSEYGFAGEPDGADLVLGSPLIRRLFPFLAERTRAVLMARRCGWFSGQQLGMLLLQAAKTAGVRLVEARLEDVDVEAGRVTGVGLRRNGSLERLRCDRLVVATGPFLRRTATMMGLDLPVFSELHVKVAFEDVHGVVPRAAPLMIWEDGQHLPWTADERSSIEHDREMLWLLDRFPPGVHMRPEGGAGSRYVLVLWPYHVEEVPEVFPIPEPPHFAEIAVRGISAMVPGLSCYFERPPRPWIDGGYYTRTRENRPLIGPLPIRGAFVIGALSGFGLMASQAAAELLAAHMTGASLPTWAAAFTPARYENPAYLDRLQDWGSTRQL
jgi:glycine/D-amino acid oxidase-like deaminating enzyme